MCPGRKAISSEEEHYRKVFKHLDFNGGGKITVAEFVRVMIMVEEEEEEEEEEEKEKEKETGLRQAFKMYADDKRKDFITARSLKRTLSRLGEKTSIGECDEIISVYDLDGDGLLSFHEYKIMMS